MANDTVDVNRTLLLSNLMSCLTCKEDQESLNDITVEEFDTGVCFKWLLFSMWVTLIVDLSITLPHVTDAEVRVSTPVLTQPVNHNL